MPKQPAIPGLCDAIRKMTTRRENLLAEMDAAIDTPVAFVGINRATLPESWAEGQPPADAVGDDAASVRAGRPDGREGPYDSQAMCRFADIGSG